MTEEAPGKRTRLLVAVEGRGGQVTHVFEHFIY